MFSHKTDLRSYDRSLNRDSIDSSQQSQQSPDSKSASFPSYCLFVVFVAVIASFENGWNLGVTNIPGHFQTLYGRRNTLLFNIMTWIFGGLLLGIALHPLMFVAGRILAGIGSGIGSVSVPTYIGEIATIKSRGAIGTIYQLFLVIGILITQLLGLVLSFVPGWRILLALTAIPALIQLILLPLCVESPRYLISQNRFSEAKDALQKLRNGYNIENEFQEIVGGQTTQPNGNRVENDINGNSSVGMSSAAEGAEIEFTTSTIQNTRGFIQILKDIHCRKMLLICFGLNMVQQLCGINGIILYSTAIFLQTFGRGAKYATLGVGIVNLSMTLISAYLVDKKGRKPLLFISFTGMCISSILVVIGSLYHHIVLVIVADSPNFHKILISQSTLFRDTTNTLSISWRIYFYHFCCYSRISAISTLIFLPE
ncbi:2357_t:CDS:2, partial [Gigaspora rosea]